MNQFLETIAMWLADYYLLSSVLLAISIAALALMRQPARRRAHTQSVIVAMFVLGALCAVPGWSTVSLLTRRPQAVPQHAPEVEHSQQSAGKAAVVEPIQRDHVESAARTPRVAPIPSAEAVADFANATSKLSWQVLTSLAWTGGALCVLMWLALGSFAARRMRRDARTAPSDLRDLLSHVAALNSGALCRVELLLSNQIETAVALGIWRPAILLPAKWAIGFPLPLREACGEPVRTGLAEGSDGSRNVLQTVLAHELAHIENRDLHWLAASRALLALLWAQPLFWLLRQRMRLDQEALADAAAAEVTSRQSYAEQLVAWARDIAARPAMRLTPAVGLWEGPSQLRQRIALFLDERFTVHRNCSRTWQLSAVAISSALAAAMSLVTLTPAQSQTSDANSTAEAASEPSNQDGRGASNESTAGVDQANDEEEQGSQMLRDIRAASAPILAAMAKDHGYGLEPGRDLRRVAPPFPPIRMEYYRTGHPSQSEAIKEGPSAMMFRWRDGKLRNWGMMFGDSADPGYNLTGVLDALLDIKSQQIDGPRELLRTRVAGDWVIREGAEQEAVLKQLQDILHKEFALPVKLEFREVERDVYVARGEYELKPLPGQEGKGKLILTDETITTDEIQVFGKQLVPNSGAGGGTGEFEEFLGWLGRWIGTPIVSEVDLEPTNQVSWHLHERSPSTEQSRGEDHDPALVLGNITVQTGLTFTLEKRPVRILFAERLQ
jgi:beta-lactamase regulating signal transducer with metallopeptidase domain